jgi:hypothetical protein
MSINLRFCLGIALLSYIATPSTSLFAQGPPTISGNNAFWYLNGASDINGYFVETVLTVNLNGLAGNTITWTTDSSDKVSIQPNGTNAIIRSLGASGANAGFDIHVTVTVDGVASSPYGLLINTPTSLSGSGPSPFSSCNQEGLSNPGYVEAINYRILDLVGNTLAPIATNESLEHQINVNGSNYFTPPQGPPGAAIWSPGRNWNADNTFTDQFGACGFGFSPAAEFQGNSGTETASETQKFWIGTSFHFQGVCVQHGAVDFFTDHVTVGALTPVVSKFECNSGVLYN